MVEGGKIMHFNTLMTYFLNYLTNDREDSKELLSNYFHFEYVKRKKNEIRYIIVVIAAEVFTSLLKKHITGKKQIKL
jgi:glutaminase